MIIIYSFILLAIPLYHLVNYDHKTFIVQATSIIFCPSTNISQKNAFWLKDVAPNNEKRFEKTFIIILFLFISRWVKIDLLSVGFQPSQSFVFVDIEIIKFLLLLHSLWQTRLLHFEQILQNFFRENGTAQFSKLQLRCG